MAALFAEVIVAESPWMQATGIPPHVEIYKQQKKILKCLDQLPLTLVDHISNLLDEKGVASGNITKELLRDTIKSLILDVRADASMPFSKQLLPQASQSYHLWGGKFHILPEDFEFPSTDTLTAWKLWLFGNKTAGHPPYKNISSHDLSTRLKQQTYSNWSTMMKYITLHAEAQTGKKIPSDLTEVDAADLYKIAITTLPIKQRQSHHRTLKMSTMLRLVRETIQTQNPSARKQPYRKRRRSSNL
jgi:hypothetical protein